MGKIKGKQIANATLDQQQLNVSLASIVNSGSATNVQWVENYVQSGATEIYNDQLNMGMSALVTVNPGDLACSKYIIEYPVGAVQVKVNGIYIVTGGKTAGYDAYFSGDSGVTARAFGHEQKGDYLYWCSSRFQLDTTDEIDFIYFTNYEHNIVGSGQTITFNPIYTTAVIRYTGTSGTTSNFIINGVTFVIGNIAGQFVFDIGGSQQHTFTTVGESIVVNAGGQSYQVIWDGFGSLILSIKKLGGTTTTTTTTISPTAIFTNNNSSLGLLSVHSSSFINPSTGWVVGNNLFGNQIYKTTNSGLSWTAQSSAMNSITFYSVCFTDANNGYAVGDSTTVLQTNNGGINWNTQSLAIPSATLRSVNFISPSTGWIAGYTTNYGFVMYTTNSGSTWKIQSTILLFNTSLTSINFVNANYGWVVGYDTSFDTIVYNTTNGGTNWNQQTLPISTAYLASVNFVDVNHGWIVGFDTTSVTPYIFATNNGGTTWVQQTPPISSNVRLTSVSFIDQYNGCIAGFDTSNNVILFNTTNGGGSWNQITSNLSSFGGSASIYNVSYVSPNTVYVCGNNSSGALVLESTFLKFLVVL